MAFSIPLVAITVSSVLAWLGNQLLEDSQQRLQSARAALRQEAMEEARRSAAQANAATRQERLAALQQRGRLAGERPGEWDEQLRHLADEMQIPAVDWHFLPKNPATAQVSGDIAIVRPIRLSTTVRHEEQWLDFIERLEQVSRSWLILRHCSLMPSEAGEAPATLLATCDLELATLAMPPATAP